MTRPTMFCESCESTVSTDDVHSCYDAKAVREQQERERKLAALERAVVEAAKRYVKATQQDTFAMTDSFRALQGIQEAVRALDAAEETP